MTPHGEAPPVRASQKVLVRLDTASKASALCRTQSKNAHDLKDKGNEQPGPGIRRIRHKTISIRRPPPSLAVQCCQGLLQIGPEVLHVFNAHAEPDQILRHAGRLRCVPAAPLDQRFDPAQGGSGQPKLQGADHPVRGVRAAEVRPPAPSRCTGRNRSLSSAPWPVHARVRGKPGIPDAADPRVPAQPFSEQLPRTPATARSAAPGCAVPRSASHASNGPAMPPWMVRWCSSVARSSGVGRHQGAQHDVGVAGEVLGHRVQHDVGAQAQRLLHQGVEKVLSVTTMAPAACAARGQRPDVRDAEHRVGGALQPQHAGGVSRPRGASCASTASVSAMSTVRSSRKPFCASSARHHQRTRVAVRRHHQHAAGRNQGQRGTDGGQPRGVQQARQRRPPPAGPGPLRTGPRWGWNSGRSRGRRRPAGRCRNTSRTARSAG